MDLQKLSSRIKRDVVSARVAALKSRELERPASSLLENVTTLCALVSLPQDLVAIGVALADRQELQMVAHAGLYAKVVVKDPKRKFSEEEIEAEILRLEKERPATELNYHDRAVRLLRHLVSSDAELAAATRTVLLTSISLAWTTLECVTKDAWIEAVNARPVSAGHHALQNTPDGGDGLSAKSIQVGLLARHGFDIRSKLGTLLAPKFDFTSVEGMRVAYGAAFHNKAIPTTLFLDKRLIELEKTRNLIVHRAAIVDDEFIRLSGRTLTIGAPLPIEEDRVFELVDSAVEEACRVLTFLEEVLYATSAS